MRDCCYGPFTSATVALFGLYGMTEHKKLQTITHTHITQHSNASGCADERVTKVTIVTDGTGGVVSCITGMKPVVRRGRTIRSFFLLGVRGS